MKETASTRHELKSPVFYVGGFHTNRCSKLMMFSISTQITNGIITRCELVMADEDVDVAVVVMAADAAAIAAFSMRTASSTGGTSDSKEAS